MKVPVQWLNDYVSLAGISVKELDERLVMSGSNTETVHDLQGEITNVVVGHILSIEQHPDADKLVVCQVAIGNDQKVQIVTGAKNMKVGDYVPVALDGAVLANELHIKSGQLRGQLSEGMFCSLQELGFEDKVIPKAFSDGLLILDKAYPLGQSIFEAIDLNDQVIEFEITPNRPDCLSMIGMARETAATFNLPITLPDTSISNEIPSDKEAVVVVIEDPALCPRYACRVIENVVVRQSPQWLQSKLIKAGMRPINNIVDITNFVLLEYGQPIHAFDLDTLKGGRIVIRRAHQDEVIETLDNQKRTLSEDMLVIADGEKAVAIAGVMGGAQTEVSDTTTRLLIEVANFNKSSIRETSKRLGLRSEASSRYEKGVSPEIVADALNRVCHLIEQLQAGDVVNSLVDVYPNRQQIEQIVVRPERINQLLGTKLSAEDIQTFLLRIECTVVPVAAGLAVTPPAYRLDLLKEIDFVEEVARLFGYDNLEDTMPQDSAFGTYTAKQSMERMVRDNLTGQGLQEICTYSFQSPKVLDALNLASDDPWRQAVMIRNPLGEEFSMMRPTLYANMLAVISRNAKRQVENASIYEIGNTFKPKSFPVVDEPIETRQVGIAMMGEGIDFYQIKGAVEGLLSRLKINNARFVAKSDAPTFHPGRCASIWIGDTYLGLMGEIHPEVAKNYDLVKRVYLAEIDYNLLFELGTVDYLFTSLPKFPAAMRDIAVTVNTDITNDQVLEMIQSNGGEFLASVDLFDVYQGSQIEAGKKSMAYALSFRAADRTLVEEDISGAFNAILESLKEKLQAQLRA